MRFSVSVGTALVILNGVANGLSPAWADGPKTDADCAGLARLALPHASITLAEAHRDGTFHEITDIDGKPYDHTGLPAFCRVQGVSSSVEGSKNACS